MPTGTHRYRRPDQMEPLLIGESPGLAKRSLDLAMAAKRLEGGVHGATRAAIAGLVREMNCFYSNLIEGAKTLPVDIERALREDLSTRKSVRDLQRLALSHIATEHEIEAEIDRGAMPTSPDFILRVHRHIYRDVPKELMTLEDGSMLVSGELRQRDVIVGEHVAPSADSVSVFLDRFHECYGRLAFTAATVPDVMAAHHRLTWIHPFADGNGRVARLVTGAMLRKCGVNDSLWSLSRGLARDSAGYKGKLADADSQRRGDLDGRGNLSLAALTDFAAYMIDRAIDQATYMANMIELPQLRGRVENYFRSARPEVRPEAAHLVNHTIAFGEIKRGEAARISGLSERVARDLVGQLVEEGFLASDSPRGALRAGFPVKSRGYYFPNLYPAGLDDTGKQPDVRKLAKASRRRV